MEYMWIALIVQSIVIGTLFWLLKRGLLESLQLLAAYYLLLEGLVPFLPERQALKVLNFISMTDAQKAELLERISQLANSSQYWGAKDT